MKNLLTLIAIALAVVVSSCSKFDDTEIWKTLNDHERRITALEELCKQMNTNIDALQTIVEALEKRDYITNVSPVSKDGEVIGYTITFAHSGTITIYHGENGKDGADGTGSYKPQIGVKKDADGIYYWTVDGEWLLDDGGNKIKATGEDGRDGQDGADGTDGSNGSDGKDGQDGQDGEDGADGRDGVDGVTPRLKIENDYWYVSYDDGATWIELGKATGEDGVDGSDGSDGADGDNMLDGIFTSITQDDEYVYFNLADGTIITLPRHDKEYIQFEDLHVKAICCINWDTNYDGELSYAEAAAVADIGNAFSENMDIVSFAEFRFFTALTEIPESAFYKCESLWKITLPSGIKRINQSAFSDCKKLVYINLHDNIKYIYSFAFNKCESLTNIQLPPKVSIIYSATFQGCKSLTEFEIGDAVTEIQSSAFGSCTNLKKIIIGDNVTLIGNHICSWCTSLETVVIGSNVTQIGDEAFNDCNSLKEIYCKALIPPALPYKNLTTSPYEDRIPFSRTAIIYVPEVAYEDYCSFTSSKSSSSNYYQTNWSLYKGSIKPYDFAQGVPLE